MESHTFLFHHLLYDQLQLLEQPFPRQNMRNNKPRNSRVPKPIPILQQMEETHCKHRALDPQNIDNQIHLRPVQRQNHGPKIIPAEKPPEAEAPQPRENFSDGVSRVWDSGGSVGLVVELCGGDRRFGEKEGREGGENSGPCWEMEGVLPLMEVVEHGLGARVLEKQSLAFLFVSRENFWN